jgi:putative glutathione S-transferase
MGQLVQGRWEKEWKVPQGKGGDFRRGESTFRQWISADGSTGFPAEAGRYHLYVSYACPWASRVLMMRALKKLQDAISVTVVDWHMTGEGWHFSRRDGATPDPVLGAKYLREIYLASDPQATTRVTVPVLWDKRKKVIVNNESAEIIRMLNGEFDAFGDARRDYYPPDLRAEIDRVNARVYDTVNNGVYKAGFARSQAAYEEAFDALFETLDWLDDRLGAQRYVVGDRFTEADIRLFATLIRFDAVYVGHFKCNRQRIADYANLQGYTREIYQMPEVRETVNFRHIKNHYYHSHETINPNGIVPKGPALDFDAPHGRERFAAGSAVQSAGAGGGRP